MKQKKCKWCGCEFTPPHDKSGNPQKYCNNSCRAQAYNKHKKEAKRRYNKRNPRPRPPRIKLCEYCAKPFPSKYGRKYCSIPCRKKSRQDQNNSNQKHYRATHPKSDKQKYYDNLGNSNLRQHRKNNFSDEKNVVISEKRRLGI